MNFLTFRSNALQGLTLLKSKDKPKWNKDEIEQWVKKEYERHYGKNTTKMEVKPCKDTT